MSKNEIFNSFELPVPPVRQDLQIIPLNSNGHSIIYFHDTLGYVPANFALHIQAEPLLSFINGRFSIKHILQTADSSLSREDLLEFVQLLDENYILDSGKYRYAAEQKEEAFEMSPVRPSALAGETYPNKPSELRKYLDGILKLSDNTTPLHAPVKALYAPHIDPRVGKKMYASVFSSLKNVKPKRIIILATAHYSGYYPEQYSNYPFIGTEKPFELPSGVIPVDDKYINKLKEPGSSIGFTTRDRAHRIEHSIELHLLFTQHVWNHDYRIVPILVNPFDELFYMPDGHLGSQLERFTTLLNELDDDDTFYLISGDLAHVGRKFGDQTPASVMRNEVESFDQNFLRFAYENNRESLIKHMQAEFDRYRICGFPPLYTFLNIFPELKGTLLDYQWWDETERESAVSFGSISY